MSNAFLAPVAIAGSDLTAPRAAVGTMMFGKRADEAESRRIVDAALERGLTFFDTASMYAEGDSERILGRALAGRRERCLVATKVGYGKGPDGEEEGTGREAVLRGIDASLERLGMDHVDVFYLHRPDKEAPIEETMAAMDEVVRAGKARHIGISNFGAWRSLEVLRVCEDNGWAAPVISQMVYNPLVRQIELEYLSFVRAHGLALTVYNPLAGGLLTGKYADLGDEDRGGRFVNNEMYRNRYWSERMFDGMRGLGAIAADAGLSLTHLTLAWILGREGVDNILLGPSITDQLLYCLAAGDVALTDDVRTAVDRFLDDYEGTDACYAR